MTDDELIALHFPTVEDERKALVAAAQSKQAETEATALAEAKAEEDAVKAKALADAKAERRADPVAYAGLDHGHGGEISYTKTGNTEPPRSLVLDGVMVEHVAEDEDGVWLYRRHVG